MAGKSASGAAGDLAPLLLAKLREQVERAEHLLDRIPPGRLQWRPRAAALSLGELLSHLVECLAGFCAALCAAEPVRLAGLLRLRRRRRGQPIAVGEARRRLRGYWTRIEKGFALLNNRQLGRLLPTVFVPRGEPLLTILLGNLEHLLNHKHQLFIYLKLMGVSVTTRDLYQYLREPRGGHVSAFGLQHIPAGGHRRPGPGGGF